MENNISLSSLIDREEINTLLIEAEKLKTPTIKDIKDAVNKSKLLKAKDFTKAELTEIKRNRIDDGKLRISVEKLNNLFKDYLNRTKKKITDTTNEVLIELIQEENRLKGEEEKIENYFIEIERKKQEEINNKIVSFANYDVIITEQEIKKLSEEEYKNKLAIVKKEWEEKEKIRKEEEEKERIINLKNKINSDILNSITEKQLEFIKNTIQEKGLNFIDFEDVYNQKLEFFKLKKEQKELEEKKIKEEEEKERQKIIKSIKDKIFISETTIQLRDIKNQNLSIFKEFENEFKIKFELLQIKEEKENQIRLDKIKKETEERTRKEEQERLEKEKIIKEKEEKEKQDRLEKEEKYKEFLKSNNITNDLLKTKEIIHIKDEDNKQIIFYKKIATFNI